MKITKKSNMSVVNYSLVIGLILAIISLFVPSMIDYYLKGKPTAYFYKIEKNYLLPVLMITKNRDIEEYKSYYKRLKTDSMASFNFDINIAPFYEEAYIVEYSEDSLLIKVSYRSHYSKPTFHYWVLREFMHKYPPPIDVKRY